MAKAPKKTGKKGGKNKKAPQNKKPVMRQLIVWVIAPLMCLLFFATFTIFAAGMMPTMVAYMIDKNAKKYATRTVGYLNASGCFIVALDMWSSGDNDIERALELLADPFNWLIMFGLAGVGWVVFFAVPPVVAAYMAITADVKLKEVKKQQETLRMEWGTDVEAKAPEIPEELEQAAMAVHKPQTQKTENAEQQEPGEGQGGADQANTNKQGA